MTPEELQAMFANASAADLEEQVRKLQAIAAERAREEAERKRLEEEEAERRRVEEERRRREEERRRREEEEQRRQEEEEEKERRLMVEAEKRAQEANARRVRIRKEADRLASTSESPAGMADAEMAEATTDEEVRKVRKTRKGKTRERKVAVVRKRKRLLETGPVPKKRAGYAETDGESSAKVFDP